MLIRLIFYFSLLFALLFSFYLIMTRDKMQDHSVVVEIERISIFTSIIITFPWNNCEIGIVGVRKGNVRLPFPLSPFFFFFFFFFNIAMTVQYLVIIEHVTNTYRFLIFHKLPGKYLSRMLKNQNDSRISINCISFSLFLLFSLCILSSLCSLQYSHK